MALDGTSRVTVGATAIVMVAYAMWTVRGGTLVLDDVGVRSRGRRGAAARWDDVAAIRWSIEFTAHDPRPSFRLVGRDGRAGSELTPGLPAQRIIEVDGWLRTNRPDIRIDPTPPWRDRFASDGVDPAVTRGPVGDRRAFS